MDHDQVVDHQRRAREAPTRDLLAGVCRRVARPHDGAVGGFEHIEDAGGPERVHPPAGQGGCGARPGAGLGLPEPGRVAVAPHQLSGGGIVAGDDLLVSALLLGVEQTAGDGERRPARPDRPAPQLDRRRGGPVGFDPDAGDDAVAAGTAKAGPAGARLRRCRGARGRRQRHVAGPGQKPVLGRLRPPPGEVPVSRAGDAGRADQGPAQAGDQDCRDQRRAPGPFGEAAADHRPGDEGQAQQRDGVDEVQESHSSVADRFVEKEPRPDERHDHQANRAPAL